MFKLKTQLNTGLPGPVVLAHRASTFFGVHRNPAQEGYKRGWIVSHTSSGGKLGETRTVAEGKDYAESMLEIGGHGLWALGSFEEVQLELNLQPVLRAELLRCKVAQTTRIL